MKASIRENAIPKRLRKIDKWGLWRFFKNKEKPGDKPRKVPLTLSNEFASSTNPSDFSPLRDVLTSRLIRNRIVEGLAFALFDEDDITVFDFDNYESLTRKQQQAIMKMTELTYSEWSQSGNGVHCFFTGHDARILRKKFQWCGMQVEVYRSDRFIAVTGNHIDDSPKDLREYDRKDIQKCLGKLPPEAMTEPMGDVDEETALMLKAQEPRISDIDILAAIERDAQYDTRDAAPVSEWLEEGYDRGDDMSSNDLIVCKVLWKYGATYEQIEEIVAEHNPRGDDKWQRQDYRSSTILRAYGETAASGFDVEGSGSRREDYTKSSKKTSPGTEESFKSTNRPHKNKTKSGGKGSKGNGETATVSSPSSTGQQKTKRPKFRKKMKKAKKRLHEAVREYNEQVARLGAGQVAERAVGRISRRIDKLRKDCYKIAGELNLLDVQRLNQWYGEVVAGGELRVGAYYNGKKRLMRWESFEKVMRSQREAVTLKERVPRGRAETGVLKVEAVESAQAWLAHPEHMRFPYEPELIPDRDMLVSDTGFRPGDERKPFNMFEGVKYRPTPSDVSCDEIIEHILMVWAAGEQALADYILDWFARMVQYPQEVGETAIVLQSIEGVGKNIITNIFKEYYGMHAIDITDMDSVKGFNAQAMRSIMTVFNEATYGGNKKTAGALKAMITDKHLTSQEKYQPAITHRNCCHVLIFSNNDWIVPVGLDDRRFLILECDASHMGNRHTYFERLIEGCIKPGGGRSFIHYLMERDISGFNPRDIPAHHKSDAHIEQALLGMSPLHKFVLECVEDGGIVLSSGLEIEWRENKYFEISITDFRDAFIHSHHLRRGIENSSLHALSAKLEHILGCKVIDVPKVKMRSKNGRGRGIKLPPKALVMQKCKLLGGDKG